MTFMLSFASAWNTKKEPIEINTLKELVDFSKELNYALVLSVASDGTLELQVYDDYLD